MASVLPRPDLFELPPGVIYLDGNSLGPMPKAVADANRKTEAQWRQRLVRGWNDAGWMDLPLRLGDRIARLVGAAPGTIVVGDTLSIQLYQALSAALALRPERRIILTDDGNFPSDLYIAQGLTATFGRPLELRIVAPEAVEDACDADTAVVMLTHVDYRTGRRHDLRRVTARARACGAVALWDLAHSAGAVPVDLADSGCELAVGCTYKYLNGGPGAPAFIYARPDLICGLTPALTGWLGHARPFAFEPAFRPARSIERFRVGTPAILHMRALEAALTVWDDVDIDDLWRASVRLTETFIAEVEARCPMLELVSPRPPDARGSHVSFAFEHGYPAMQALIDRGVIGDFRAPDIMRFGFAPLYLSDGDVRRAAVVLEEVMTRQLWREAAYQARRRVT